MLPVISVVFIVLACQSMSPVRMNSSVRLRMLMSDWEIGELLNVWKNVGCI
ncbi:hypothetical protein D3C81_1817780 [compost metagenome]